MGWHPSSDSGRWCRPRLPNLSRVALAARPPAFGEVWTDEHLVAQQVAGDVATETCPPAAGRWEVDLERSVLGHGLQVLTMPCLHATAANEPYPCERGQLPCPGSPRSDSSSDKTSSRFSATRSRSVSKTCSYTVSVKAALRWPRILCTAEAEAPVRMSAAAAEWRRTWTRHPGVLVPAASVSRPGA